jgi:hypothetical protein
MKLIERLSQIWSDSDDPFMFYRGQAFKFSEIASQYPIDLSQIHHGDVVALIGDFDPSSILTLLRLIDLDVVIVPLTIETTQDHEYFFKAAQVDVIIQAEIVTRRQHDDTHPLM